VDTPRQPRKAVVDGRFEIPEQARLFDGSEVILFTAREDAAKAERLQARNARVVPLPGEAPGRVDLPAMMRWLAQEQVNEVHVEAGAGLSGALVSAGCVDELLLYLAPVLLGDAADMVRLPMLEHLEAARRYEFIDAERVGADLRVRARVADTWRQLMQRVELPALS
jgi:diaminohydroxyphosphoribosylaminopyrimidine deaminase/5-amino-6-(5-phosphoribosylamino)uracil reductase